MIVLLVSGGYIVKFLFFDGKMMDRGVGMYKFSKSLNESKEMKTFISKYCIYNKENQVENHGWLEYCRMYDIHSKIIIDKTCLLIVMDSDNIKLNNNMKYYWEAFYKDKKLTAFEDKGFIKIIGVDSNMDTIILKQNKKDIYYLVKQN